MLFYRSHPHVVVSLIASDGDIESETSRWPASFLVPAGTLEQTSIINALSDVAPSLNNCGISGVILF